MDEVAEDRGHCKMVRGRASLQSDAILDIDSDSDLSMGLQFLVF